MGNCSGLFANCNGEGDTTKNAVKRIDPDRMKQAMRENEMVDEAGRQMMQGGREQVLPQSANMHQASADTHYN